MIHNNQSLLYVSYSWNFRHRLVRLYWYTSFMICIYVMIHMDHFQGIRFIFIFMYVILTWFVSDGFLKTLLHTSAWTYWGHSWFLWHFSWGLWARTTRNTRHHSFVSVCLLKIVARVTKGRWCTWAPHIWNFRESCYVQLVSYKFRPPSAARTA